MDQRIKQIRKSLGMTQDEFASRISVKRNTIATYEAGVREPMPAIISAICREFSIREEWLRTGEGQMRTPSIGDEIDAFAEAQHLTQGVATLLRMLIRVEQELGAEKFEQIYNDVISGASPQNIAQKIMDDTCAEALQQDRPADPAHAQAE